MVKEIGGYFGLEQLVSNEYHKGLKALNSGRNALLYLLKAKNIKKIFLPYYLCDAISGLCSKYVKYEFYHTDSEFMPVFDRVLGDDEYLYVVNYFGQITERKVLELKRIHNRIIIDNAQAFLQKPIADIDTIYTCRKYFGVPDGGYLATDKMLAIELEIDISRERMNHILGRYEGVASDYYSHFMHSESSFNIEPLKYMSKLTHNLLGAIDYERVRLIRNENYEYLESEFYRQNKLKLTMPDGAFAYPLYAENGIQVRKAMAHKRLFIPILWPNVLTRTREASLEYKYAANILPLPCDQRYGIEEMKYLVEGLRKCIN